MLKKGYKKQALFFCSIFLSFIFLFINCFNIVYAVGINEKSIVIGDKVIDDNSIVRVIVKLKEGKGEDGVDISNVQDKVTKEVLSFEGAKIIHKFNYVTKGFSLDVKYKEIDKIRKIHEVEKAFIAGEHKVNMNFAKDVTKVYDVWNNYKYKGEGTVVAVLDSGLDINHKDMRLTDTSKAKLTKGKVEETISGAQLKGKGKYYTYKVPYGYNYADNNDIISDTSKATDMHGMHVAGIVGANATKEEVENKNGVQGIAPECQILAMRIFSNDPKNSKVTEDTIIAAIEDSILLHADVINISIGAEAGFAEDEFTLEYAAIKKAVDNGIPVVCAAGNSSYSTFPEKYPTVNATGTVDTPGVYKDSIAVGAVENSKVLMSMLNYKTGDTEVEIPYTYADVNPVKGKVVVSESYEKDEKGNDRKVKKEDFVGKLEGEYELIDCGYGTREEICALKDKIKNNNKIVIAKRGQVEYEEMKRWAYICGAVALIVYNTDGNENILNIFESNSNIPSLFIKNSDGKKLKDLIEKGVRVSFKEKEAFIDNYSKGDMYPYSAWGPAPCLDFKPDVVAPGTNIFSTIEGNAYKIMHGTSMASPHVAGIEALISQGLKEQGLNLENRELFNFKKNTLMNTAVPQMDKDYPSVPFSPRRQGAGLVQVDKAIKNKVLVTNVNENPYVALKEVNKNINFELTLKNLSDKEVVYNLSDFGGVYREIDEKITEDNSKDGKSMPYEIKIDGAEVKFDKAQVKISAKGLEKVKVDINLPDNLSTPNFVEGYVRFLSENEEETPSLTIPYMGYYGDWDEPQIMDKPFWEEGSYKGYTCLIDPIDGLGYGTEYPLGYTGENDKRKSVNPDCIAISPNGDKNCDYALPKVYFLRGAKEVRGQILDVDKNVLRNLETQKFCRATVQGMKSYLPKLMWDGVISDDGKVAPNGQYYMRLIAKADIEDAKEQVMDIPIKVDVTPPEVEVLSTENYTEGIFYKLIWKAKDKDTGLFPKPAIFVNNMDVSDDVEITIDENGVKTAKLPVKEGNNKMLLVETDNAGVPTAIEFNVKRSPAFIKLEDKLLNENELTLNLALINSMENELKGHLIIGLYDKDNKLIKYYDEEKTFEAYNFEKEDNYSHITEKVSLLPETKVVRCMLWQDLKGIKPYANTIEIPIK